MEDFDAAEDRDGLRFSWNVWPSSRIDASRLVIPFGCLYTPLAQGKGLARLGYEPLMCKSCRAIVNPFCDVDVNAKLWTCTFCFARNSFPAHYAGISAQSLPAELLPQFTTVEYELPRNPALPPCFLFVIDTALSQDQLEPIKESLLMALTLIPSNATVGLITFGSTVLVHELSFDLCPKAYVFNGKKNLDQKAISRMLGFGSVNPSNTQQKQPAAAAANQQASRRFLVPLSDCEETLETILEELQPDPYPVKPEHRRLRSTGVAVSVAATLLSSSFPNSAGRVMLFAGGPCTQGPGLVVSDSLKEHTRSHAQLQREEAKYTAKATKHYEQVAAQLVGSGHAMDIFACALDQCGLMEMQDMVRRTGGLVVQCDGFESDTFKDSFKRIWATAEEGQPGADEGAMQLAFNAAIEVQCSKEIKVCGCIGHCASLNKKGTSLAETEIGIGNTTAWRLCSVDPNTSLGFFFDVVNQHNNQLPRGQKGFIQFLTHYQNSAGKRVLRVTTTGHPYGDLNNQLEIASGFDQEATAVLMARIAVLKAETQDTSDILRWLDRMLIRLASKFAQYRKDDPASFRMSPNFTMYPQFMFHLRRSHLLQVFGQSPDETSYVRMIVNRENVGNGLMIIQPTLDAYTFQGPPTPVLLSATSLAPDRILVLDTFFHVVVWCGENIAQWRKAGYHHKPDYAHLAQLLEAPKAYTNDVRRERFPLPRFVSCDQGTSQARFLLAVVDPSVTHTSMQQAGGEVVITEDVNLEVFMDHLKKLSVQS